jgi:hypothetical protein
MPSRLLNDFQDGKREDHCSRRISGNLELAEANKRFHGGRRRDEVAESMKALSAGIIHILISDTI